MLLLQSSGDGKNFRSTIYSILGEIDIVCDSNNIEDFHRFKGGRTIINFSSRRESSRVLNKKKKLKICILESMASIMGQEAMVMKAFAPNSVGYGENVRVLGKTSFLLSY